MRQYFLVFLALILTASAPAQISNSTDRIDLRTGWNLQTSAKVQATGEVISTTKYQPRGWYKTAVPSTVLAAQVTAGDFHEPYVGMNLRNIPGMSYQIGEQFAHMEMAPDSPYAASWWYRKEFRTPPGRFVSLQFNGINNRANIWLNGKKIADAKDITGAYRTYEFDITQRLEKSGVNVLAVEVFAQKTTDLGINWVDWNPTPPDKNMGLWSDVFLTTSGPVQVRYPEVITKVSGENSAELTVVTELHNTSDKPVEGTLQASIEELKLQVQQKVALAPGESKSVKLMPEQFPQLRVKDAKLWWPAQMGRPNLYHLKASFAVGKLVSDRQEVRIGLREITSELTDKGARLFRVNGKRILIRGGGWAPDILLRRNPDRLKAEFDYVRDMNLNTIRLEGKLEDDEFFRLADERGILVMAGWCCCDIWEEWGKWGDGHLSVATASVRSQVLRLRAHPSVLVWLNGSDNPPPAEVERAYIQALQDASWPNPYISSATATPTTVTGPSGVKMTGPYDYVPPSYWLIDSKHGGAYSFNTETSPGPAVPPVNSLRKIVLGDHLWPIDDVWNFHSGSGAFKNLKIYNTAMNASYGEPTSVEDYTTKSQAMAYDGERAMFEAYSRNKYTSTGVIQWMLNNGWPSLIWHLYDYYLQPAGGYFGTKKANEPLHIMYSYDDRSVAVINSTYQPVKCVQASVRIVDFNLKELFAQEKSVDVDADGVQTVLTVPEFDPATTSTVYFVQLALKDSKGSLVSTNFYWLSTKKPELDWAKTKYVSTPILSHEDMTMLAKLPKVQLRTNVSAHSSVEGEVVRVRVQNPSKNLAFQVRLAVESGKTGDEVLPVLWEDNYVSLMPGESREISARFAGRHTLGNDARLVVSGWNIEPKNVALSKEPSKTANSEKH